MVTYIPEDKLLLPNGAFSRHIVNVARFDEELGWEIAREKLPGITPALSFPMRLPRHLW